MADTGKHTHAVLSEFPYRRDKVLTCSFARLWRSDYAQSDGDHRSGDVLG